MNSFYSTNCYIFNELFRYLTDQIIIYMFNESELKTFASQYTQLSF